MAAALVFSVKTRASREEVMRTMRAYGDEFVVVNVGTQPEDLTEITINCPDKIGLGCDIARIVFEFGLSITRGDLATDGRWCFLALWVIARESQFPTTRASQVPIRWMLLKQRLEDVCPSALPSLLPHPAPEVHLSQRVMLLQVCSSDRTGLLNDVAQKLWELEFTIHKVKVSTSPEEKSINFFFVTENRHVLERNVMPWKKRGEEVIGQVKELLGPNCSHCEMRPASPQEKGLDILPAPAWLTKDLFFDESASCGRRTPHPRAAKIVVKHDIQSPLHTLLQVTCKRRKGLLYDCLRCVKDLRLQVAHMRIASLETGNSEISVFFLDPKGQRITEKEKQDEIYDQVREAIDNPLRIKIGTREDDTELVVSAPIETCGRGRPRVVYDVTLALRELDICIFQADIGRHLVNDQQWEVYRFLLLEKEDFSLKTIKNRNIITDRVQEMLIG